MKFFKEMVKLVRMGNFQSTKTIDAATGQRLFWEAVVKNEVFVFTPVNTEGPVDLPETDIEQVDAPFEVFSIEIAGNWLTAPHPSDEFEVFVGCVMYVENPSPAYPKGIAFVYVAYRKKHSRSPAFDATTVMPFDLSDTASNWIYIIVQTYLERLSREKDGVEEVTDVVMIPSGKKKKPHPIRRVFHISPKNSFTSVKPMGETKKEIDWSHQWSVRGCWVRFFLDKETGELDTTRIGKDRNGDYCVPGKTWRIAHAKGPKDKPLIKKTRIVHA